MVLLVVAAVFLAVGLEWWANEVAIYAYFALVAGVVLQLVCFLKFGGKGDEKD
jgi:heme/copper-type cytochrome/quinol oxidase subunit 4